MTRTIVITNATMVVKDINGIERTIEKKFIGSGWTSMKIMKDMKPADAEVVSIRTVIESRQYKMSNEDFISHAKLIDLH